MGGAALMALRQSPSGPVIVVAAEIPSCSFSFSGMSSDGFNEGSLVQLNTGYDFALADNPAVGADPNTRVQVPSAGRYEVTLTAYAQDIANVAVEFQLIKALNGAFHVQDWTIPNTAAPGTYQVPLSMCALVDIAAPLTETIYLQCPAGTTVLQGRLVVKRLGPVP